MWRLLACLLAATAAQGSEPACPPRCDCPGGLPERVECALESTQLSITVENGALTVDCQPIMSAKIADVESFEMSASGFNCSEVPQQPARAVGRLQLQYCALPGSLACVAGRLGAPLVPALYLMYPQPGAQLTADHVRGMGALEKLGIYGLEADNTTIPTEALAQLPSLRSFTMNRVSLALRPGDFAPVPDLRYLELSTAGITHLPAGVFSHLTKLEQLSMWKNKLEDFGDGLQGLVSLRQLDASNNRLSSLTSLLTSPPPLTALSIFANNFTLLPPLANLTNLESLELFDNLSPLQLSPGALAGLPRLTRVDLARCGLTSLPGDLLAGTHALTSLKLAGNDLETLPDTVFMDLKFLEELDLSHNKLQQVSAALLRSQQKLKKLLLNHNQLLALPTDTFSRQYSLRWLSVSHNRLRTLPTAALLGVAQLEDLDLSHNAISDEEDPLRYQLLETAWFSVTSLQRVSLAHNRLRAPPPGLPRALLYLQRLDLSYNLIDQLTFEQVFYSSDQAQVDVRHNAVTRVFPLYPLDPTSPPSAPHRRSAILLDDNPFHCDCQLYSLAQRLHGYTPQETTEASFDVGSARCVSPPSLRGLLVNQVPLADLTCTLNSTDCVPSCTCELRPHVLALHLTCPRQPQTTPDLTHFGVTFLDLTLTRPPQMFNLTDNIRNLNLSGLNLQEFPKGSIPPSVQVLDLSRNNLTRIPRELLEKNVTLRLSRNPLVCDCWHSDDVASLQEHWAKIADYSQMNCTGNIPVDTVNVHQLCSTWRAATVGGVLAALGLLIAIVAILLVRYSEELKVWLYARGWFLRWLAIDDDDRKYDAFISFCHKDEEFVIEHLIPGLEAPPHQYKLCVHYRDWIPGEWIPAQIAQSVNDSRRTVIVVSQNFLDSIWGRAEFRAANMSAIKERKTRVIVVLLEDITSHKELDPELKLYLSTNTYLKWGDPWFWDKLRYALPHRRVEAAAVKEKLKKTRIAKTIASSGLDTRLTADGVIINAAALAVPDKKVEHIHLEVANLKKMNNFE